MSKRITNDSLTPLSKDEAMKLLRTKCLPDKEGLMPAMQLLGALMAAYPTARLPPQEDGEPGAVDWQTLAWLLAIDFVPAFQEGKPQGRTAVPRPEIVSTIDSMINSGEAKSVKHACGRAEWLEIFPGVEDVRKAYYRERKKLSQQI
jgi:hypothetical protein